MSRTAGFRGGRAAAASRLSASLVAALGIGLGIGLGFGFGGVPGSPIERAASAETIRVGDTPAVRKLGELPVMSHEGRVMPLDTMAREKVKRIYGREEIAFTFGEGPEAKVEKWNPIAALLDWSVNPDEWDERAFILVEYVPLKTRIFDAEIRAAFEAAEKDAKLDESGRSALEALKARGEHLSSRNIEAFLDSATLDEATRKLFEGVARRLSETSKWISPKELQDSRITVDGRTFGFTEWATEQVRRQRRSGGMGESSAALTPTESKSIEVLSKLLHYQWVRDRANDKDERTMLFPRPANEAYLRYIAETVHKAYTSRDAESMSPLELDTLFDHSKFLQKFSERDRLRPSSGDEGEEWVETYLDWLRNNKGDEWLRENAVWVPLRVVLTEDAGRLEGAGFPGEGLARFRAAFAAVEKEFGDRPENLSLETAEALIAASRGLGEALAPSYPSESAIAREIHYNRFAPFARAPLLYGFALVALILGAVVQGVSRESGSAAAGAGRAIFGLGMLGLLGGLLLEAYGFYLRVLISGYAPVTNMYETVIWVAFVTSTIGFLFECFTGKKYPAIGAAIVALAATTLAANVPLGGEEIKSLTPVLRSNYWLTIHVLTIVSSYAAFALALGLGLIGVSIYLTATYRRRVSYREFLIPIAAGLPFLVVGGWGSSVSQTPDAPEWLRQDGMFHLCATTAIFGGFLIGTGVFAALGEALNRLGTRGLYTGDDAAAIAKAREDSMRANATRLKPIAQAIYRSMQIGVLLVTAGTILGGVWADDSWGRFWGWDPKEVWALITLLVYLIPLHGRFAGWINVFGLVVSSVVCFLSVLMAWYGVNFVLGVGLHSYGFVEGGGQMTVAAVTAGVLSLVAGSALRRHRSYMNVG